MYYSVAGIVKKDSQFLIAKRIVQGQMGGRWEFPGGKLEEGENFTEALIREFKEEFAATVSVGKELAKAEFVHNKKKYTLHAFEVYIAQDESTWQLTEHTEFAWATIEEIKNLHFVDSDLLLLERLQK